MNRRPYARRSLWKRLVRDRSSIVGLALILAVSGMAILAPVVSPYDPLKQSIIERLEAPSASHWFGTDRYGRDVLSRTLWGARASLALGICATLFGAVVGGIVGLISGYLGGWFDEIVMFGTDILMSFPAMLLAIIVVVSIGAGFVQLIVAVGMSFVPRFTRLTRASAMEVRTRAYVEASKAIGQSELKILLKHILPNIVGEVVVMSSLWIATAIRFEANLSFLGLGIQPPTPSWGSMIRDGLNFFLGSSWLTIIPGIAILLATMGFNIVGDAFRDALDPKVASDA